MSAVYLNSISENASRLGMRLQESFSEHTRDLAISRGTSSVYLDASDDKSKNIRKQLDSSSDREKLDAMKRLVALISKGRNVSEYFAQVVKNVASHNLEIRKMVYIYLLKYAEQEPDLALLSINTFQKDLTDSNPLIRAMALRVLSGIKVPMIGNIIVLAIKKCAADISPYVRKVAALAIPKCYDLDNSQQPSLIEIISSLLRDRSPLSIGSIVIAFEAVCPTRLDLIHQQYRRLCRILVDADEWGQVELLNLLLRYARTMLSRPIVTNDGEELDKDLKLLISSAEPLFQSRNPAVILAVTRVMYYGAPQSYHSKIIQPLLRLMSTSKEAERVVLTYALIICRTSPTLFSPFYTRFVLRTDDLRQVKQDKITVLLTVMNFDTHQAILRELIDYAEDPDDQIVAQAIRGIGRCAYLVPECTQQCLSALIAMIRSTHDTVVSSAVIVLKHLVQSQLSGNTPSMPGSSQSPVTIISHLARKIDDIHHPQARACVLWLAGQYAPSDTKSQGPEGIAEWAPDVLRKTTKSFGQETVDVKLQVITLAAKLFVLCPGDPILGLLSRYVFSLARYDLNYDVRDRARMFASLLVGVAPAGSGEDTVSGGRGGVILRREQVLLVLFEGKNSVIATDSTIEDDPNAMLGSLDVVTRKPMHGDHILPEWLEDGVESSLRDTEDDTAQVVVVPSSLSSTQQQRSRSAASPVLLPPSSSSPSGSGLRDNSTKDSWTDLDKFYEDEDNESEEEDESEEDEEDGDDDDEAEEDVETNVESETSPEGPDLDATGESSDEAKEQDEQVSQQQ